MRECSAFSPPLSEIRIVWQKSPLPLIVKRPNSVFRAGVFKDQLTRDNGVLPLPSRAWDLQDTCQGDWPRINRMNFTRALIPECLTRNNPT